MGCLTDFSGFVSGRGRDLSVLHSIQSGIRAHSVSSPVPGVKQAGNEDGCSPPSHAIVTNVWTCTRTVCSGHCA